MGQVSAAHLSEGVHKCCLKCLPSEEKVKNAVVVPHRICESLYINHRPDPEEDTCEKHFQGGVALKERLCWDSAQGALTALQPVRP